MARPSVFSEISPEILERIHSRPQWPVTLLAELLGCRRETIYRHFPGATLIPSSSVSALIRQHGARTREEQAA